MALYSKYEIVAKVVEIVLIPMLYHSDLEIAKKVSKTVVEAGSKLLEFTNRGHRAFMVSSELSKWRENEGLDLVLGAGTVLEPATAALYINLGADFIVGPNFGLEVAKLCNERVVVYVPGCSTITEIYQAEEYGAELFKIFPEEVLIPRFVRNILAPCPWLKLIPSGGLTPSKEVIDEWIGGVVALNRGTSLLRPDLINAGDYTSLRRRVEQYLQHIREAKSRAKK
jgi:2-dehydro-3-deoxyphosphogluconate aldolase/(4S)-4-hydroxy-2-oxoglutarate aldolase